ncbi:MAG: hypothetical protein CMK71_11190 [Pseudomonadaceae bacterium]|nr:hypothetical protein [Pseudomonadaceae bacterium]
MGDTCVICLEPLGDAQRLALDPCGHDQFHASCILHAMRASGPACPLCRNKGPQEGEGEQLPSQQDIAIEIISDDVDLESLLSQLGLVEEGAEAAEEASATERRACARRNRCARRDAGVREHRDAFWDARERRRQAERALAETMRPLDREARQLWAKHRAQTRAQRSAVQRAQCAETAAESVFHEAADAAGRRRNRM